MPSFRKYFEKALKRQYGQEAETLIATTDQHYALIKEDIGWAARSKNPLDKRLDVTGYWLAMIKTLDARGESFDKIRTIALEIVIEYASPKNWLHRILKKQYARLIGTRLGTALFKWMDKKARTNENPQGFIARVITNKEETYGLGFGIDILECGICKLFKKHGYERFVPILCEVDKITSAQAGLVLIRTSTIGYGAHKCDFRFKRDKGGLET